MTDRRPYYFGRKSRRQELSGGFVQLCFRENRARVNHQNGPTTMPTMAQANSSTVPMTMITSWKRGVGAVGGSAPAQVSRPSHAAEAGEDDRSRRMFIC